MSETLLAAIVAAAATLGAVVATQAIIEVRSSRADQRQERRAVASRIAEWHLNILRHTRRQTEAEASAWEATAIGDFAEARRYRRDAWRHRDGNIRYLGDAALVRRYQDVIVLFRDRLGQPLTNEDRVQVARVMGDVASALDAQERRVLSGEEPRIVSATEVPELFDPAVIVERLRIPSRRPLWLGRLNRWLIERALREDQTALSGGRLHKSG